jgi:hypothetical protein
LSVLGRSTRVGRSKPAAAPANPVSADIGGRESHCYRPAVRGRSVRCRAGPGAVR